MFLQLWPVIYSVNKADDRRSQRHGWEKNKILGGTHSEILVAHTASELGVEAMLKTSLRENNNKRNNNNSNNSKPQQKSP